MGPFTMNNYKKKFIIYLVEKQFAPQTNYVGLRYKKTDLIFKPVTFKLERTMGIGPT